MNLPLETPVRLGRSRTASGTITVVPELRSYRYDPKPCRLSAMQMLVLQLHDLVLLGHDLPLQHRVHASSSSKSTH